MLRDVRRCSSELVQSFECTRVNFREMPGTATSMGDYGHSDVIKEECEAALSLCVHCVSTPMQHEDFVDPRALAQNDQCISVYVNIHSRVCLDSSQTALISVRSLSMKMSLSFTCDFASSCVGDLVSDNCSAIVIEKSV